MRNTCVIVPDNSKYHASVSYCPIEGFEPNCVKCSTPNSNVDSGVFPHEAVLGHSWVSHKSTSCWHYLPRDNVRSYRFRMQSYKTDPFPHHYQLEQLGMPSSGCSLFSDWPSAIDGSSYDPSLRLVNLLEWLTEPREVFYLLDFQFILKG